MGPADAVLIPLGFCLTVGCTASLVLWFGRCQVGHKHEESSASIGLRKGGGYKAVKEDERGIIHRVRALIINF